MVNVPCYSMGTAPRSMFTLNLKIIIVREVRTTSKETPGPG
jgi:hypothetical protein